MTPSSVVELSFRPNFRFALIQPGFLLLLIPFLDLYDREPLSTLALLAVWGAVGAGSLLRFGNTAVSLLLSPLSPRGDLVLGAATSAPEVQAADKEPQGSGDSGRIA